MPIGITPELEQGKCALCGSSKPVRLIVDNDRDLVVRICVDCAGKSQMSAEELLEKYGKESKAAGKAEVLDREKWLSAQRGVQKEAQPRSPS